MMLQTQVLEASSKLFEYGLLGVLFVILGFIAWKFYMKIDAESKTWKKMALDLNKSQVEILIKQNETNNRLLDIRKKDVAQTREFYNRMETQIDRLPTDVAKELKIDLLEKTKTTPAG